MVNKVVVADAGPLIAFGRIKNLSLLSQTLGTIIVPTFELKKSGYYLSEELIKTILIRAQEAY